MKTLSRIGIVILLLLITFPLFSDEGMWMPHQMQALNLKSLGLKMDPADLYKKDGAGLMSAVVHLGGGTGEFVSKDGLILTNHHVAFGALQRASDPEHDYIEDGFIAWNHSEEIPAAGYIADVLLGYDDVTARILSAVKPGMSYKEEYEAIDKAEKQIVAEAEKTSDDIRAEVAAMYSGNQYYLYRFKRLKDIRIVYAPPRDLGNFGGDIDNWMWPRHTCDFSFLRAYVSKNNVGVDYNEDNVPYNPKSIIKISLDGVNEGDFTFVMGYPGRTYRNYTLSELLFDMDRLKKRLKTFEDIIAFYDDAGKNNKEVEIKYASIVKGLNNSLKNYQGKLEGMEKVNLVQKKEIAESEFLDWMNQNPQRKKEYGDILDKIDKFGDKYAKFYWRHQELSSLVSPYFGSAILSQAYMIYRTAEERQKPDIEREPAYQDRNFSNLQMRIKLAERSYDLATDKEFLKNRLKQLFDIPIEQVPEVLRNLVEQESAQKIDTYVDDLYHRTVLADPEKRLSLLEMKPEELMESGDPFIDLAAGLEREMKTLREESESLSQERMDLKKVYMEAQLERHNGKIAPDANGTIRFTYGTVQGYSPRDAVYYQPKTSLQGVIEKNTGTFPFHVPDKLIQLHKGRDFGAYMDKELNDIPVCFLNTTNVTGGNSGSPTLNANGEQVGIIFDMTYESVIGDYYVIPDLQRTISVDVRYVLFVTDKFSGATHILKEIGIQ